MNKDIEEIKSILKNALDIGRWAPKSNEVYSFIDEEEIEEMVENIIRELYSKGYKIIK